MPISLSLAVFITALMVYFFSYWIIRKLCIEILADNDQFVVAVVLAPFNISHIVVKVFFEYRVKCSFYTGWSGIGFAPGMNILDLNHKSLPVMLRSAFIINILNVFILI
ncbi:hypothetical protein [Spartinivicinus ruber]|uniref:hypothetical protein n=1 Tax=Spartinivicinus ruber TaxID=2683272 RepID=UPI0013D841E8|nr:hypothetical protein [Spartinivicinus ruber]